MALDEFVQKLIVSEKLTWSDGNLNLLGIRGILLPAPTFMEIILKASKNTNDALNALYEAGVYHGKQLAVDAIGRGMLKLPKETLIHQYGPSGNLMGLGQFNWTEYDPDEKRLVLRIKDSVFVDEFRRREIKTKSNVCSLIVGIASGMAQGLFDSEINAKEVKCALHGSQVCEIIAEAKK